MKRTRIWNREYKKPFLLETAFLSRGSQRDSNCCGRFCRPLPNHSVREPTSSHLGRGSQQIRTAVDGFADRYLTTRSGNHFRFALQRYNFFETAIIYAHFPLFGAVSPFFFPCRAFQPPQFTVCRTTCTCRRVFRMTYEPVNAPSHPTESHHDNEISYIFMPHKSNHIKCIGQK